MSTEKIDAVMAILAWIGIVLVALSIVGCAPVLNWEISERMRRVEGEISVHDTIRDLVDALTLGQLSMSNRVYYLETQADGLVQLTAVTNNVTGQLVTAARERKQAQELIVQALMQARGFPILSVKQPAALVGPNAGEVDGEE